MDMRTDSIIRKFKIHLQIYIACNIATEGTRVADSSIVYGSYSPRLLIPQKIVCFWPNSKFKTCVAYLIDCVEVKG